jgi:hypothetical protein
MLPGGSGELSAILAKLGKHRANAFPPASRVSISELLGRILIRRLR